MKPRRLDADAEGKRFGRSDASRRVAGEYIRRSRVRKIAESYRPAYGGGKGLGEEWAGWEDEGSLPRR